MKKVITAVQTGKDKWEKRTWWKLSSGDIVGCVVFGLVIGWVLFQVVRAC